MANIVITRYEFTDDNPFGGFLNGDVLEVYLDTDLIVDDSYGITTGITVKKNGASYTSTAYFFQLYDPIILITRYYVNNLCLSSKLIAIELTDVFPFSYYRTEPNSPTCAVNPPACDLIIFGIPTFTQPTGETVADATMTVTATSSSAIQYKLGSDFVYGDGQASGTFTGLLQGSYRVYVRDERNCKANVLVKITYEPVYGTYYSYEYKDVHGNTTVVDIDKKNYIGAETEILGGDNALVLSLRGEGETDKFAPVLSTQADLNIVSETDQYFIDLYTNDRDLFRVNYYKEGVLKWRGKLLPFRYLEDYKSAPYYVTITATDGLAELSEKYLFNTDGGIFQGTVSLIKLIAYCLQNTGLYLPIKVGINLYADDMAQTASDDPLDQAYCDYEAFYIAEKQPSLAFVLENILKPFKARIIQWDGYWNIVRVEELGATYAYREYDRYGDYVTNSTFNPVKDINYPDTDGYMFTSFPTLELRPGYGQVNLTYNLGLPDSFINNGNFSLRTIYDSSKDEYSAEINKDGFIVVNGGYALTEGYEFIDTNNVGYYMGCGDEVLNNSLGGEAYIKSQTYFISMGTNNSIKISVRFKVTVPYLILGGEVYKSRVPYIKVRILVKYGTLYLAGDGNWTSIESTIDVFVTTFGQYQTFDITANQPLSETPLTGMDFEIRVYHAYAYYALNKSISDVENIVTYSGSSLLPTGFNTELRDDYVGAYSTMYFYTLEETTNGSAVSNYFEIQPLDWHVTNNPRKWFMKFAVDVGTGESPNQFKFFIDYIKCTFLDNGENAPGQIVKILEAEPNNNSVLEYEEMFGSGTNIITTESTFNVALGFFFPKGRVTTRTVNNLSFETLYKGWLRSSADANYEFWARDGADESAKLHDINLKVLSNQYSASWRLLRGSVTNRNEQFSPLNSLREVNDSNRIYIPISMTIDDRACTYGGEFLELLGGANAVSAASAFTTGFNIGYN